MRASLIAALAIAQAAPCLAAADERITIANLEAAGDCTNGDVGLIKTKREDILRARFESLSASASDDGHDKEVCRISYELTLPEEQKLDALKFTVDSRYRLSDEGEVRITVKHRVGDGRSFGKTEFRATADNDPAEGGIDGVAGVLAGPDLSKTHQQQGATIPVVTTIIVSAVNGAKDESAIRAIEGISSVLTKP